ncbi:D,D-dipeptide ABC transporter permease [Kaustia mangrovi]|uniref:D,D-dipeptide ABC transporter permease n=1 Tax=Kaustia mangrovi TaxID=2593653 RepID=A0A7S8HD99_9HYPH|nr:D,D-dipeptide ABC transporter permease [Kaustia mangrovi]QPC44098.1 D,D-dipeptide ABC transporter permease [Kaustia mangrovi]
MSEARIGRRRPARSYFWWRVRQSPLMIVGLAIIAAIVIIVAVPQLLATHDPNAVDIRMRLAAPGWTHFFGTDEVGRDIYSRVIHGARQSVGVGFFIVLIAGTSGVLIGAFSGIVGGRTDTAIMRIMDVVLSVPSLVLTIALAAALGPSLFNAMLAIALVRIPFYVRLTRGQTLSLREIGYVQAARSFGASRWHLIRWHVGPNTLSPIIVQATLDLGAAILMASALSFIGLGAQQPTAEWGAMVATGRTYIFDQWWYSAFPGFAILVAASGFNLFGDGLRDILDPKERGR